MPPPPPFDPFMGFGLEIIYTLIVVFLCFLVYFKTKEIYDLTKHKGIYYFRTTFLFFGLAYAARIVFHLIHFSGRLLRIGIPRDVIPHCIFFITGYLSTMALLYLTYSTVKKKTTRTNFFIIANIIALGITFAAIFSREVFIISQIVLLIIAVILSCLLRRKKRFPKIVILYVLLFLFWFISLFLTVSGRALFFEQRLLLEIVSIGLFVLLYYKVAKWTK